MLGKIEGSRSRGRKRMRWLNDFTNSMVMNFGKLWEVVRDRETWRAVAWGFVRVGHDLATEQQQQQSVDVDGHISLFPTSSLSSFLVDLQYCVSPAI